MRRANKLMRQSAELASAAPQVIAMRLAGMLAGGLTPDAATRREYGRMGIEKLVAAHQSFAQRGLAPVHAHATANLRRLRRRKAR